MNSPQPSSVRGEAALAAGKPEQTTENAPDLVWTRTRLRIWHRGPVAHSVTLWPRRSAPVGPSEIPDAVALERLITNAPERLGSTLEWLKRTSRQQIGLLSDPIASSGQIVYCKVSQQPGRWRNWLAQVWPSLVRNAFRQSERMRQAGLLTPRAWMAWEWEHQSGLQSGLVTETVPDAKTLDHYLDREFCRPESLAQFQRQVEFFRHLGRSLAELHAQRFDHRDLKAGNLLIRETEAGREIWFVDLDGVRRWWWLPPVRRIQNLARLTVALLGCRGISKTALLRGLLSYLGDRAPQWRAWWRQISRRMAIKLRRRTQYQDQLPLVDLDAATSTVPGESA